MRLCLFSAFLSFPFAQLLAQFFVFYMFLSLPDLAFFITPCAEQQWLPGSNGSAEMLKAARSLGR